MLLVLRRRLRNSAIALAMPCVLRRRVIAKVHRAKLQPPLLLLLLLWRRCRSAVGGVAAELQLRRLGVPLLLRRRLMPGCMSNMTICVLRAGGSGRDTVGCCAPGAAVAIAACAARPHGIKQLLRADGLLAYRLRLLRLLLLRML